VKTRDHGGEQSWEASGKPWPVAPEGSTINIHHIKPLSKGGTNSFSNLVPLIQPEQHQPFTNWWRAY
jgi:HNH endonuclease